MTDRGATVLVVGGAGVFGSRFVERLAHSSDCTILVAGRSMSKAALAIAKICAHQPRAMLRPWVLERERVTPDELRATGATIVVDAAGPFQGQEPQLARAAIAAGCHFIDLADARDYVAGFSQLDQEARAAQVLAVCGAGSTPALSHAALEHLHADQYALECIEIAISPGNRAPRGLSVMQAILSYAGQPIKVTEAGCTRTRAGWSLLHRRVLHGLPKRWFSLCETPDLDLLPQHFPTVRTARFYAGLELGILHCGLWALSLLVRARLLASLVPHAPALLAIAQRFERFGTDRGGMLVQASGWDDAGDRVILRWGLIAEAGDGPYIPVLPALALIRKLLSAEETRRGAQVCVGLLRLEEIVAEFKGLKIQTYRDVIRTEALFKGALKNAFESMPLPIRKLHSPRGKTILKGIAQVEGAASPLGRFFARLFRFPVAGRDIPIDVTIEPHGDHEIWRRRFGESEFSSILRLGHTRKLTEQFGLLRFMLAVDAHEEGLDMTINSAKWGIVPLPRFLMPWTRAQERVDASGRFTFDVEIGLPGIGRLVRYRGWLSA